MTPELSRKIIKALFEYHHDIRPALDFENLYELAVSVVLSAQTTDRQVNLVTPGLFRRFPDFTALAGARLSTVETLVKSTGFYHHKARHIIELAKKVVGDFGGTLPETREALMALPGIGRKSANVILAFGFGRPAIAVDTHVLRISNRLGYVDSEDPLKAELSLVAMIPEPQWIRAHLVLIHHGRTICTARKPRCPDCPVRALCPSADTFL